MTFDFSKTHILVDNPTFFQKIEIGDIVKFFSTGQVGVVAQAHEGPEEKGRVFEVVSLNDSNKIAMPFESECTLILQRRDNWCRSMESEAIAKQQAETAFTNQIEFDF